MRNFLADISIGSIGGGSAPILNPGENAPNLFTAAISSIIGIMTIIAGIWFLFNIITGGLSIIGAGSDKGAYEEAKGKITNGLIGLIIVIGATFIVSLLGYLLGITNILDPASFIDAIGIGGGTT